MNIMFFLKPKSEVAYIYDDAIWFYYQENLDALKEHGATLYPLSLLSEKSQLYFYGILWRAREDLNP